ncbi:MAG: hypothetical protein JWN67_1689 [Actinomycetia bacterium]|nr:hypothetical protein [Actinomycetes bacterium]
MRRERIDPLDEIARLLALQIRLTVGSQSATIAELDRIGFTPVRMAELLGTTSDTAKVTAQRARKKAENGHN